MSTDQTLDATAGDGAVGTAQVAGGEWDRYELGRELGRGGMGVIHQARVWRLGRTVALKFIRGGDPRGTLRLLQEARAQARVDHPGICKIYEVGEVNGRPYIAMQLIDGVPLHELAGRATVHDKVHLVRDLALALHAAHSIGVLHRDIKPANVLVETDEDGSYHPVLMDFGLARHDAERGELTEAGALLGTPAYMSPEQARGEHAQLDRRSDVYGLGATLYELLGGAPPFQGDTQVKVLMQVMEKEPLRLRARVPSLPADLETIAEKCLAKEPGRRYDSARALADDLDRYIRGEPILGRRAGLASRLWRHARRNRAISVLVVALAVASALAVRARVLSGREAAAAALLSQDIQELEWFLRTAHLLPAHDLSREEALVRQRMAAIGGRAGGGGLVDYALGRGHLALHEDDAAAAALDRARAAGLDTAELHHALGLVLGRLYDRELAAARARGTGSWLDEQARGLDARYLRPALAALEKSRGVRLESPSLLEGLIAYYRKDYPAAIALGARAHVEAPWLYDGTRLQADAYLARAVDRMARERDAATADLEAAARLYDAALDVGRSDASLYLGRTRVWSTRMGIERRGGAPVTEPLARAEEWCRLASLIAPGSAPAYVQLADARYAQAERGMNGGEDTRPLLRLVDAAARLALERDGENLAAHLAAGFARHRLVAYAFDHGGDPRADLEQMLADLRQAAVLGPRAPRAVLGLGAGHMLAGRYRMARGEDPIDDLRSAVAQFTTLTQINPDADWAYNNLIGAHVWWAEYRTAHGLSPRALAPAVEQAASECARRAGGNFCHVTAALLYLNLAEHELDAGQDPGASLGRAGELLAGAATTGHLMFREASAWSAMLRARAAPRAGSAAKDGELATALASCFELEKGNAYCARYAAEGAALHALAPAELAQARALAAAAVAADPRSADGERLLARAEQRLGDQPAAQEACARGLAIDPHHPHLLAVCGALRLRSPESAQAGRELIARAVLLNPFVARDVEQR